VGRAGTTRKSCKTSKSNWGIEKRGKREKNKVVGEGTSVRGV